MSTELETMPLPVKALDDIMTRELIMLEANEKVIDLLEGKLKGVASRDIALHKARLNALEAGFIPIEGTFVSIEKPRSYNVVPTKRALNTMPTEIKDAMEEAKESGLFTSFWIGINGGDPVLVGNAGKWHFFIAAWINIRGGSSAGFRFRRI